MVTIPLNNSFEIFLISVLCIATLLQFYFYLYIFRKAAFYRNMRGNSSFAPPISIIIAAKNEDYNLEKHLTKVLSQKYPEYEVIIINDGSTDQTEKVILNHCKNYSNVIILNVKKSKGKKNALSLGINKAKHDYLLFIDADCYPNSEYWLKNMVSGFVKKPIEIVLGYGSYKRTKGLLNAYICYDSFFIALQYFGATLIGKPYMGVGRNLAYKKELWVKNRGFESHTNIPSGDDDLFVIQAGNKGNIAIIFDDMSKTFSETENSFKDFFKQKLRHFSSIKKYRLQDMFFSGGEIISRALFYSCVIYGIININFIFFVIIFLLRLLVQLIVIYKFSDKLNEKYNFYYSVFFDIFAIFIYVCLWITKIFSRKKIT